MANVALIVVGIPSSSLAGTGAGAGAVAGAGRRRGMAAGTAAAIRSSSSFAAAMPLQQKLQLPSFDGLRTSHSSSSVPISLAQTDKTVHVPLQTANVQPTLTVRAEKKAQKRRQIVLVQDIPELGKNGDLVSVKTGYFRNFLYPTGKAKLATAELLKSIKLEGERIENEKRRVKEEAELIAKQFLAAGFFNVRRRGGQGKQIFGSVTSQDVVDIVKAQTGRDIDKRVVTVPDIREVGQYAVEVKLHPEVIATVRINVIAK